MFTRHRHRCEPEHCKRYYRRMVPWVFVGLFAGVSLSVLSFFVRPFSVSFGLPKPPQKVPVITTGDNLKHDAGQT